MSGFVIELTNSAWVVSIRNALKEKTANQLADAFVEMLDANSVSATELAEVLLGSTIPKKQKKWIRVGYKAGWKYLFKSKPEPDKAQLAETLAIIEAFKNAPHKMRSLLKQKIKEMPHAPGGPPRKIRSEEEKTVCAEISGLRPEYDTREAIRRVAQKRRVSERTIYRIWGKYNPKKKKTVATRMNEKP